MIRRLLHLLLLGLSALVGAHTASAQTVRWDPIQGTLAVGQTSELQLIFEDCSPTGQPRLPNIDGLTLEFAFNVIFEDRRILCHLFHDAIAIHR